MKKFLSTALALGLVAGAATVASAWEFSMDGHYKANGYYISEGNGAAAGMGVYPWDDDMNANDDWYEHEFRINPTIKVNDKVHFNMDIRLIDDSMVWGKQDDTGDLSDGRGVRIRKGWLVYESPIGKWEIGRRPAGAWMGGFVNSSGAADRIMLWLPTPADVKAYAFLQKSEEVDGYSGVLDDNDNDYYEVAAGYQPEGMKVWLGAAYSPNKTNDVAGGSKTDFYRVKGYGEFGFGGNFAFATEFDYKFGTTEYNVAGMPDTDINAFAFIGSLIGNFGDLSASLHYAYISGEDNDPTEATAYDTKMGTGKDFEPLYILTGSACNILNGDRGANPVGTAVRTSGAHAIVALADFKASEDLTLHGGLGWGQAADVDGFSAANGLMNVDDAYGYEVDLGMAYKLYDNLTYELHFGYWAVGDFAELGSANLKTEDVYMLSHHLTMKF